MLNQNRICHSSCNGAGEYSFRKMAFTTEFYTIRNTNTSTPAFREEVSVSPSKGFSIFGLIARCSGAVSSPKALDRGAAMVRADKIATGHNADDIAETVLLNILRGDIARLSRCTLITTGEDGSIPRCKPFKYTYEKEIVMYAYFKKLDYFSTECIYSPNAYRGFARDFIKDLEQIRPRAILDIIRSGENFRVSSSAKMPEQGVCERCGYISSQKWCKACVLLDGLNRGLPKLGISRTRGRHALKIDMPTTDGEAEMQTELTKSKPFGSLDF